MQAAQSPHAQPVKEQTSPPPVVVPPLQINLPTAEGELAQPPNIYTRGNPSGQPLAPTDDAGPQPARALVRLEWDDESQGTRVALRFEDAGPSARTP